MSRDHIRQQLGRMIDSAKSGLNAIHQQASTVGGGGSYFYPSTLEVQRSAKSGWLRRQSSGVVRAWQRRWFTLKGDYLYYYAGEDEAKAPLGAIYLVGASVTEHAFVATDIEKFRFEVILASELGAVGAGQGGGGGGGRAPESHLLSAESEEERRDWIRVIKLLLYSSVGGAIFGQRLDTTLRFEMARDATRKVPEIVQACVEYLTTHGLQEEGLFRLPGRSTLIKQLREEFDCGGRPPIDCPDMDVQTAASLLKLYLRELPEPLIPLHFYEEVMNIITRQLPLGEELALQKLVKVLQRLPLESYNMLQYLCRFLSAVVAHSTLNKMTAVNLATVFVQAFIRPELDDPALLMGTVGGRTQAALTLISRVDRLFVTEFSANGAELVTTDLLGLDDDGVAVRIDQSKTFFGGDRSKAASEDLLGLELGPGADSGSKVYPPSAGSRNFDGSTGANPVSLDLQHFSIVRGDAANSNKRGPGQHRGDAEHPEAPVRVARARAVKGVPGEGVNGEALGVNSPPVADLLGLADDSRAMDGLISSSQPNPVMHPDLTDVTSQRLVSDDPHCLDSQMREGAGDSSGRKDDSPNSQAVRLRTKNNPTPASRTIPSNTPMVLMRREPISMTSQHLLEGDGEQKGHLEGKSGGMAPAWPPSSDANVPTKNPKPQAMPQNVSRPSVPPRILNHARKSSLESFNAIASANKSEPKPLARSNSSFLPSPRSSATLPPSIRAPQGEYAPPGAAPVVPPRPTRSGSKPERLDSKQSDAGDFPYGADKPSGSIGSSRKYSDQSGVSVDGFGEDSEGDDDICNVDVSRMSHEGLRSHVVELCVELKASRRLVRELSDRLKNASGRHEGC